MREDIEKQIPIDINIKSYKRVYRVVIKGTPSMNACMLYKGVEAVSTLKEAQYICDLARLDFQKEYIFIQTQLRSVWEIV